MTRPEMHKEISCRVTCTLLGYVREANNGTLGHLLDGLPLGESYLCDTNNWVSHAFLQRLYRRMIDLLGDEKAVYHMALASHRLKSLGILDRIVRLFGSPKHIYSQAARFNNFLKLNGSVVVHEVGGAMAVLSDHYHDGAQKTRFDCDYTRGILAGIPTIFGLPPADVEEIECQVVPDRYGRRPWPDSPPLGCDGCLYRVRWLPEKRNPLKRFFKRQDDHFRAIEDLVQANQLVQSKYDEVKQLMADLEATNRQLRRSKAALEARQAELLESERKYRNLFENGSDLICIHDLKGNLLETNLQYKAKYGWQQQDLEGMHMSRLMPERHRASLDAYLKRIVVNGDDEGYVKGITKTGEEITLEYRNTLIRDKAGRPKAVHGAARDVTHRIRYEKALRESRAKYKELVQHVPAGIYEFDMQTLRFTSVNEVICEKTGYSRDEFMTLDPYVLLPEAGKATLTRLIETVFADHPRELSVEYTIVGKNKKAYPVLVNSRFFYENGLPRRAFSVVHDLTEIRRAEEEKKALEVKLQNARKLESLGALAGGVAHDLNNILSGIVSYPDLLLMDIAEDSALRKPLLTIRQSGQKAADIVQDLLTLARRSVATKKVVRLNQIVNEFIATPEYLAMIDGRSDLTLELDLVDSPLNLVGSDAQLSKTLMNLVKNAVDAMPSGGNITIATRGCYLDQPHAGFEVVPQGEYAVLEIADTGIGIAAGELSKIFEPFYTKKVMGGSGTGLGMSVVWGTVKDHAGYIDIITAEGTGTTFVIYYPLSRSQTEITSSVYIEDYMGSGESILVVDDAAEQRDLATRMMQRIGYTVTSAASGEEAIALVGRQRFDLLILDMIMPPGLDGLETYRRILEIVPGQKAVIASGYARTENVQAAQRLGAGSYIKKPFTLEKIGLAVRRELDR